MYAYGYISRIRNRCLWLHDVDRQIISDIYVWACWCTLCGNDVAWPRPVQLICTWTRWSYACSGYIIYVSWQHVYAAWNTGMMRVLGTSMHALCVHEPGQQAVRIQYNFGRTGRAQKLTSRAKLFLLVSVQKFKLGIKMQTRDKREWWFANQLVSDWIIARFDLACTNYSQTYSAPYFLFNFLLVFVGRVLSFEYLFFEKLLTRALPRMYWQRSKLQNTTPQTHTMTTTNET